MTFKDYNEKSSEVLLYPKGVAAVMYLALGVNGEAGELGEKVKKVYRDSEGVFDEHAKLEVQKEIGDVMWYLNRISEELGFTLEQAAELNLVKIQDRIARDMVHGEGDNR